MDLPPPPQLGDREAEIWRELAWVLPEWPVAPVAILLLADCCHVMAALERQREILAQEGVMVAGWRGRMVRNRRCAVVRELREEFWRYDKIFGFTPGARARLKRRASRSGTPRLSKGSVAK